MEKQNLRVTNILRFDTRHLPIPIPIHFISILFASLFFVHIFISDFIPKTFRSRNQLAHRDVFTLLLLFSSLFLFVRKKNIFIARTSHNQCQLAPFYSSTFMPMPMACIHLTKFLFIHNAKPSSCLQLDAD